jgi:hypothetical protein
MHTLKLRHEPLPNRFGRYMLALLMLTLSSCSGSDHPETAPVSGSVTIDGKPLSFGQVFFSPTNGRTATGEIHSDGTFTLSTFGNADGAVIGMHRVAIQSRPRSENKSTAGPPVPVMGVSLIPEAYGDQSTSGLSYEVVDGDNQFKIELKSK